MKICFIFDGIPHYHVYLLNEINKVHPVTVIMPRSRSFFQDQHVHTTEEGDFQRVYVEKKKAFYGKNVLVGFKKAILTIKPDIIIYVWPYFLELITAPSLRRFLKAQNISIAIKEIPFFVPRYDESQEEFRNKAVLSMRDEKILHSPLNFFLQKKARKILYSKMVDYAFNYIEAGKELIGSYGLPQKNIFTTYNSDNTDAMMAAVAQAKKQHTIVKNPYKLIHIGRLVPWKRVDLLIQACAKLKADFPKIEVDVIGSGPEMKNLKELAKSEGISDKIHFLGPIYDPIEKVRYFLEAGIYVLAGMGGLSINEAMAYGLPIVCSVCDGTEHHLVFDDKNGRFFQTDNLDSLVNILKSMLANPSKLEKMGKESLQIIQNDINEHVVVRAYLDAFAQIEADRLKGNANSFA